jgi:hypothetical protein
LKQHRKLKSIFTRFSDFILGFLAALLVITLGRHAMAQGVSQGVDSGVNTSIKEEYIRIDLEQRRAALQIANPRPIEKINMEGTPLANQPVVEGDSLINHEDDISAVEQTVEFNRPRVGVRKTMDPFNDIEQKIADEQAYQLYREHYRGAVKDELIRRAHERGFNPSEDLAAEVTSKAISRGIVSIPEPIRQPANGIPQN